MSRRSRPDDHEDKPREWINVKVMTWAMERAPIPMDEKVSQVKIKGGGTRERVTRTPNRACQLVLWALASRAGDDSGRHCYPSLAWLADRAMLNDLDDVRRALRRLEKEGIICAGDENYPPYRRLRADRRPNIYDCMTYLTREQRPPSGKGVVEVADASAAPLPEGGRTTPLRDRGRSSTTPLRKDHDPPTEGATTPLREGAEEVVNNTEQPSSPPQAGDDASASLRVQLAALSLCEQLADAITANDSPRPEITDEWLSAAEKLIDEWRLLDDENEQDRAESVIRWCPTNEQGEKLGRTMGDFQQNYSTLRRLRFPRLRGGPDMPF